MIAALPTPLPVEYPRVDHAGRTADPRLGNVPAEGWRRPTDRSDGLSGDRAPGSGTNPDPGTRFRGQAGAREGGRRPFT